MMTPLNVSTPNDLEIVMTRDFDAPRQLVWEAMTRPELLKRWLFGPPGWEMTVCEDDPRVGGAFRWAWRGPGGQEMAMHGVYRAVVPHERIVRTESFDFGCPSQAGEQVGTLLLTDEGKKTKLTLTVVYPSGEEKLVLRVPNYRFDWQIGYELAEPLMLPRGAKLKTVAHYDNSKANKFNPDPTKVVKYGPQSWDEMHVTFVGILIDAKTNPARTFGAPRRPTQETE